MTLNYSYPFSTSTNPLEQTGSTCTQYATPSFTELLQLPDDDFQWADPTGIWPAISQGHESHAFDTRYGLPGGAKSLSSLANVQESRYSLDKTGNGVHSKFIPYVPPVPPPESTPILSSVAEAVVTKGARTTLTQVTSAPPLTAPEATCPRLDIQPLNAPIRSFTPLAAENDNDNDDLCEDPRTSLENSNSVCEDNDTMTWAGHNPTKATIPKPQRRAWTKYNSEARKILEDKQWEMRLQMAEEVESAQEKYHQELRDIAT
ncbi:hypothetical protein IW261DRAFT_1420327, partial [Armillaria novae-zelandiae]